MNQKKHTKTNHEAALILCFSEIIKEDSKFGIKTTTNIGSDSAFHSDIEYLSNANEYLIIEAKSHESKDAYNTRHKIFGQLLKEHGKTNDSREKHANAIALGILIPKDKTTSGKSNTNTSGYDFYRNGYLSIPEPLFTGFGELANVKYVFICSVIERTIEIYTWPGFRAGHLPIHSIFTSTASIDKTEKHSPLSAQT